ncbi:MAG: hypothetical protein MJ010_07360 [Paludibacteraceae bacterium]|nr:hypothetical protein [Paludibacteraceae bacterium]
MKKFVCILEGMLMMFAFVSCKKNDTVKNDEKSSVKRVDMEFFATSEGALKTTVKPDGTTVVWSEGDVIKVFAANDEQGSELPLKSGDGKSTAVFSGQCGETGPWTAVYPSSIVEFFMIRGANKGIVVITTPSVQTYNSATFAPNTMPSVAYSTTTDLNFKHLFGVLKLSLQLKEGTEAAVKSLTITDNDGKALSGTFWVSPFEKEMPVTPDSHYGNLALDIDCGDGVALSANAATDFWIVVPPGVFENGFDVVVKTTDSRKIVLSTTKSNIIEAGVIKPMPVQILDFGSQIPPAIDACGNEYNVVKIGEQYWMTENMHCNKYSSDSEAYKSGLETVSVFSEEENKYLPYYLINGGSYYYNWAAAVGLGTYDEIINAMDPFESDRQGICPSGFHLPDEKEVEDLKKYIEETEEKGGDTVGKYLKSTTGWYFNGNGVDSYGFTALPAGKFDSDELKIKHNGYTAFFWHSTPYFKHCDYANYYSFEFNDNKLHSIYDEKYNGLSVRCVKD